jgi:hypothetical protein
MKIDELESAFKSAAKTRFTTQEVVLKKIALITDLQGDEAQAYQSRVREFLDPLPGEFTLSVFSSDSFEYLDRLVRQVNEDSPDLVCTYRNLNSDAWQFGYSLGEHLELLTQATDIPVLVLPNPKSEQDWSRSMERPSAIMVVTDHLTGDDRLVNYGLAFTPDDGNLYLSHVEDEIWYRRFLEYIAKIPAINTATAEEKITSQLIKEPTEYANSVREALQELGLRQNIEIKVTVGQELEVYREWLKAHSINLVILNTKDEHQTAMSGFAHAFAVEFRNVPTLML